MIENEIENTPGILWSQIAVNSITLHIYMHVLLLTLLYFVALYTACLLQNHYSILTCMSVPYALNRVNCRVVKRSSAQALANNFLGIHPLTRKHEYSYSTLVSKFCASLYLQCTVYYNTCECLYYLLHLLI